jgi:glucose-6-phosphate isomerase
MSQDWSAQFERMSFHHERLGFSLDLSGLGVSVEQLDALQGPFARAFEAMAALEAGAIANPDEQRQVGHYWLRAPELAPSDEQRQAVVQANEAVLHFASEIHFGSIRPQQKERFRTVLMVGIGGSALGPQLVCDALSGSGDAMQVYFVDNTDPDGIDRLLDRLAGQLDVTLTVVVSKSGGTKETRNAMLEIGAAYQRAGLDFGRHAAAITSAGSKLDDFANEHGFMARFPMWDWVGGRTSVTSAVGLVPAALQGADVTGLLAGARAMDEATRVPTLSENPAALLAAAWHLVGNGRGEKAMVVIPYKDRLQLLARYLQQLVMESIGKRDAVDGKRVDQGLTVYGNKGSTDQHAYVQQLLDGPDDFFLTFVEVLRERTSELVLEVEPGITSGDYLFGFLHGTRRALAERGRSSILITVQDCDASALGALIALYERAVGLYASLVDVNAYHQPAVESGKRAAADIIALQQKVVAWVGERAGEQLTAGVVAEGVEAELEPVMRILWHLAANPRTELVRTKAPSLLAHTFRSQSTTQAPSPSSS